MSELKASKYVSITSEQTKTLLMMELQKGLDSAKREGWISEEDMWKEFGDGI